MKTAKETSIELIDKYRTYIRIADKLDNNLPSEEIYLAKNCVLILIDENVKMLKLLLDESTEIYQSLNTPKKLCVDLLNPLLIFWNEVKDEIANYENK